MDFQYSLSTISKILLSINKTSWLYKTVFGGLMYIAGVKVYFLCVFVLTIIDVITGIMAALKKGEKFTSKVLKKGLVEKFFLYTLILIAVMILESVAKTVLSYTAFYFVFLAAFLISTYETVSILENILTVNPNLKFIQPLVNLVTSMQKKAIDKAEAEIEKGADSIRKSVS